MDLKQLLDRLKALSGSMSAAQLATLGATFVAVVAFVVGSAYWMNTPSFRVLYTDLDPESAEAIVTHLESSEVSYQLDPGGTTIRVPAADVDRLRIDLAGQDLPLSGRIGFEIFDRTAFGATEFQEQVNLRRALEGEIARTISTLSEVASARVHIAMAKPSIFSSRQQTATASVVIKLRGNRPMPASTASGISRLVASSVEGLGPEDVVVIDTYGRSLSRPRHEGADEVSGALLDRQQQVEQSMAASVVSLIEPVVGAGRARVNVAVQLDAEHLEATSEQWDPESAVVRSRQVSGGVSGGPLAGGPAGASANRPPVDPEADPAEAPTSTAVLSGGGSEVTNFEINRSTSRTVRTSGAVTKIAVAVLVDDAHELATDESGGEVVTRSPRDRDQMRQIEALVAAAVGLDPARGDQLTVENISFEEQAPGELYEPQPWERYLPQILEAARVVAVLVVGLLAFLVVVRPVMKRLVGPAVDAVAQGHLALAESLPKTVEQVELELASAGAASLRPRRLQTLTARAEQLATSEPESTARIVRGWLNDNSPGA